MQQHQRHLQNSTTANQDRESHSTANQMAQFRDRQAMTSSPSADDEELPDPDRKSSRGTASPAGFSSVGSPAGSVTSPLTPSAWFQTLAFNHSPGYGAFKPPIILPQRSHDPRDAKHPLSICQLTGNNPNSEPNNSITVTEKNNSSNESPLAAAICAAGASAALFGIRWRKSDGAIQTLRSARSQASSNAFSL